MEAAKCIQEKSFKFVLIRSWLSCRKFHLCLITSFCVSGEKQPFKTYQAELYFALQGSSSSWVQFNPCILSPQVRMAFCRLFSNSPKHPKEWFFSLVLPSYEPMAPTSSGTPAPTGCQCCCLKRNWRNQSCHLFSKVCWDLVSLCSKSYL